MRVQVFLGMFIGLMSGALFAVSFAVSLLAQTQSGSVVGIIADPEGAIIGGAAVTLTSDSTGAVRSVTTDERGSFGFNAIGTDTYTLSVEMAGFKQYERTGIHLEPNGHVSVGEIRLLLGTTNEEVTVVAEGPQVQTASSERSGIVTSEQVQNLTI